MCGCRISKERFAQCALTLVNAGGLFFVFSLGRRYRLLCEFSGLAKLASIGRRIRFHSQEHVIYTGLAGSPGHLLRHACFVVLRES
jgi:hypothetical protein